MESKIFKTKKFRALCNGCFTTHLQSGLLPLNQNSEVLISIYPCSPTLGLYYLCKVHFLPGKNQSPVQISEFWLNGKTPSILPSSLSLPSLPSWAPRCPGSSLSTLMSRCQLLSLTLLRCLWGLDWNLPDSVRISFWVTCTGNMMNRKIINKSVLRRYLWD